MIKYGFTCSEGNPSKPKSIKRAKSHDRLSTSKRYITKKKHFLLQLTVLSGCINVCFSFRRKIDVNKIVIPANMQPRVRLTNIWSELADVGVAVNKLPTGCIDNTINIRYNTKTQSLFTDDISNN